MSVEIIKNGNLIDAMNKATYKGTLELCIKIVAQAKVLAPWITHRLGNAIMWNVKGLDGGFNDESMGGEKAPNKITVEPINFEGYVGFNLGYGIYREFGTKKMAPQPFLRPAIALVMGKSESVVLNTIKKEVENGPLMQGQKRETFY